MVNFFGRNRLPVFLLPFLAFCAITFFSNSSANAIVWNPPALPVTQSTPDYGEHESNCAPWAPTNDTSQIRCQTDTINPASYYAIWEPAPAQKLAIEVSDYCLTGDEGIHIGAYEGNLSGTVNYSCNQEYLQQSDIGTIYVTPTDCTFYNNNYCEAILQVQAISPKAPYPITSGINPDNSGGFYGGNVYAAFCLINGIKCKSDSNDVAPPPNSDILPAYSSKFSGNPQSSATTQGLSFNGFNVTDYQWPSFARQASLYSASVKFQVPLGENGTAYVAWKGAVSNLLGSNNESWSIQDITPSYAKDGTVANCPDSSGCSIPDGSGASNQTQAQDAAGIQSATFNAIQCHTYTWTWSGQNNADPIALSVPFPLNPADLGLSCWKLDGSSVVNNVGTTSSSNNLSGSSVGDLSQPAYFNNQVSNSGDYQASYTWHDQGCYFTQSEGEGHCTSNASGDTSTSSTNPYWYKSCTATDALSGITVNSGAVNCSTTLPISSNPYLCSPPAGTQATNPCPSYGGGKTAFQYQFSSASNPKPGDGYCERIYYSDANGPTTDDYTSTPVCIHVAQWTLSGTTKVGQISLLPGESTTFNSRVYNNGPDTASYWWWVQGCYYTQAQGSSYCSSTSGNFNDHNCTTTNAVANPCNLSTEGTSTSYITCPSDNYCPAYDTGKAAENYTFPSTATPGDGYCERIGYGNANGPGTSPDYSTIKCVTFDSSAPGTILGNCTEGVLNTGSGYGVTFPNTTTTPSPSSVTPSGISYAVYVSNSSASSTLPGTTQSLSASEFLPGEPGTAADDYANAYPYSTLQSSGNPPTSFPQVPGTILASANDVAFNKTVTITLPAADLMEGTVTWYLVLYNHVGVEDVPASAGNYRAYYSNTVYIQKLSNSTINNCFSGLTCGVIVSGTLGGQNTEGGKQFQYDSSYNYPSTSPNPIDTVDGISPTITATYTGDSGGAGLPPDPPSATSPEIDPGDAGTTFYTNPTAPNDTDTWNINVQIGYPGTPLSNLASCTSPVNDYQLFNYQPNAFVTPIKSQANPIVTNEGPGAIKKTYIFPESGSSTQPGNLSVTGALYYVPAGSSPPTDNPVACGQPQQVECDANLQVPSSPPNPASPAYRYYNIPSPPQAGDSYCILMSLTPTTGYVGPGGSYLNPSNWPNSATVPSPSSAGCTTIHNEPYVSFTGNDVIGNTSFNDVCQQPNESGIYTFSTNSASNYTPPYLTTPGTGGSASQFGAQALSFIEGFGSASFRNGSNAYPPTGTSALGLTFANNTSNANPSYPVDGSPMGGDFGYSQNDSSCEPDYFTDDKPLTSNMISVNSGNINNELSTNNTPATPSATNPYNGYNYYSTSPLTIGTGNGSNIVINNGVKATVFVNGNVYITSNIIFKGANGGPNGWNTLSDIPSLYIIAKGNILIDPGVTELDGVYIAQPTNITSTNTGIIDTCSNGIGAFSPVVLYGNSTGCNQQLTVNGAFVDQATLLDRSFSSLRYSEAGENTISNFSGHNSPTSCGQPGQDIHNALGNPTEDCAAEIFNFSPEVYLSQPSFQPASGPTIGKYNFVTSLSPTL
ncbi:MAG TPA: hypothetical protein VFN31_00190 [Candidatus Saccharimonadales bacterium]|nr:hypothetical protein [Candidatus Saccharimonadales bacterium]